MFDAPDLLTLGTDQNSDLLAGSIIALFLAQIQSRAKLPSKQDARFINFQGPVSL